jgi:hypothetical protein
VDKDDGNHDSQEEQPEKAGPPVVDGPGGEQEGGTEGHGSSSYDSPG